MYDKMKSVKWLEYTQVRLSWKQILLRPTSDPLPEGGGPEAGAIS